MIESISVIEVLFQLPFLNFQNTSISGKWCHYPKRYTKHGDFQALPNGGQITVNEMSNPYRFLITTLHEIAHNLIAYKDFGLRSNPTEKEWKHVFQRNYITFLVPQIFPH